MNKSNDVAAAPVHSSAPLPCPFCGADPVTTDIRGGRYLDIACKNPDCAFGPELCDFFTPEQATALWNDRKRNADIENIIRDHITRWGKHFGVDTSCVSVSQWHPIWQQIRILLTQLHEAADRE